MITSCINQLNPGKVHFLEKGSGSGLLEGWFPSWEHWSFKAVCAVTVSLRLHTHPADRAGPFYLNAVLQAKCLWERVTAAWWAQGCESGKWPQQPHFTKTNYLELLAVKCSAVSPPLSHCDELWQLHSNIWQQVHSLSSSRYGPCSTQKRLSALWRRQRPLEDKT